MDHSLAWFKLVDKASREETEKNSAAGTVAEEVLSCIRTVIAFNGQEQECQRYFSFHVTLLSSESMIDKVFTNIANNIGISVKLTLSISRNIIDKA